MKTEEILELGGGNLTEVTFARILHAVATSGRTLVLEISQHGITKKIIFEHGLPVDCSSNLVHETLSRFMVTLGRITREQEIQLLGEAAAKAMLFGEVVRAQELIGAEDLYRVLQQNLAKKMLDLFTWKEGQFLFHLDVPPVESPLKIKVQQLILTGCTRFVPKRVIDLEIASLVGRKLVLHPYPFADVGDLRLSDHQRELLTILRQPRSMTELTEGTAASFEQTTRFLYALFAMEVVISESELERLRPAEPVVEVEPITAPAVPDLVTAPPPEHMPAPGLDAAAIASDVMSAYLRHRRVDAWGLLGVPPNAPDQMVRESFLNYCKRFAPWSFEAPEVRSLADKAEELFLAGALAYAAILNQDRRPAAPKAAASPPVSQGRMIKRTADELAMGEELLDPETYYQKGMKHLAAGHGPRALQALDLAAKCDPQNGLYRAEAAFCLYQVSQGADVDQPLEELGEAMRIDPTCGHAFYYYGRILTDRGEVEKAKIFLQRSIKMMAPDQRPVEALRALIRGA